MREILYVHEVIVVVVPPYGLRVNRRPDEEIREKRNLKLPEASHQIEIDQSPL